MVFRLCFPRVPHTGIVVLVPASAATAGVGGFTLVFFLFFLIFFLFFLLRLHPPSWANLNSLPKVRAFFSMIHLTSSGVHGTISFPPASVIGSVLFWHLSTSHVFTPFEFADGQRLPEKIERKLDRLLSSQSARPRFSKRTSNEDRSPRLPAICTGCTWKKGKQFNLAPRTSVRHYIRRYRSGTRKTGQLFNRTLLRPLTRLLVLDSVGRQGMERPSPEADGSGHPKRDS